MWIGLNKLGHYSDPNMEPSTLPSSPDAFAALLHDLRLVRRNRKHAVRTSNRARQTLSTTDRSAIFAKIGGRCHVCGGFSGHEISITSVSVMILRLRKRITFWSGSRAPLGARPFR